MRGIAPALTITGGACLLGMAVGILVDFPVWVLFALMAGGIFTISIGAVIYAEPWHDAVERELDAREERWNARYWPECPVHGDQFCLVRGPDCPEEERHRVT